MQLSGLHGKLLSTPMAAMLAISFLSASAQQHPLVVDTGEVRLTVRDAAGMPIHNARVVMHILKRGTDLGSMEVRTDDQGNLEQDIIPIGDVVRIEIAAPGYKAFATDYPIDNMVKNLVVRMKSQPVVEVAANDLPATPVQAVKSASSQPAVANSTSTYKEAQWVSRRTSSPAKKSHSASKVAKKSSALQGVSAPVASYQPTRTQAYTVAPQLRTVTTQR